MRVKCADQYMKLWHIDHMKQTLGPRPVQPQFESCIKKLGYPVLYAYYQ
jgi:hypothetical protein